MSSIETRSEPRRSAKWQARRQQIVDTSARVFARNGYHATGLTELCAANDLGKGALYHYIGSKEELLASIHDRVMDDLISRVDRVLQTDGSPPEQLALLGDALLDIIARYPDHSRVVLHEFPALTGERAERFQAQRREFEQRVEAVLQAGVEAGDFRGIDPRLTSLAWLGMHNYAYLWLNPDGPLTAGEVAKMFGDIFVQGITNLGHGAE
jgi:AcrR family transcriptional regulator